MEFNPSSVNIPLLDYTVLYVVATTPETESLLHRFFHDRGDLPDGLRIEKTDNCLRISLPVKSRSLASQEAKEFSKIKSGTIWLGENFDPLLPSAGDPTFASLQNVIQHWLKAESEHPFRTTPSLMLEIAEIGDIEPGSLAATLAALCQLYRVLGGEGHLNALANPFERDSVLELVIDAANRTSSFDIGQFLQELYEVFGTASGQSECTWRGIQSELSQYTQFVKHARLQQIGVENGFTSAESQLDPLDNSVASISSRLKRLSKQLEVRGTLINGMPININPTGRRTIPVLLGPDNGFSCASHFELPSFSTLPSRH